ncbi:cytochrome P450 [Actinoallomurus sp. CA-142502]|uniref:cytochrome P450 n=1 Tax=Actinoallomurus sp. CA-142502 TaxID=3239885 RepID=UPI003D8E7C5C
MNVRMREVPGTRLDFQEQRFIDDPYPALHELQELGPVVYHEDLHQYIVSHYKECMAVFSDSRAFFSPPEFFRSMFGGETIMSMDVDRHDETRGIWAESFTRRGIAPQRDMITEVIDACLAPLVERLRSGERVDVVRAMTRPIPTLVIARLLGIPTTDHPRFSDWSDGMVKAAEGATDSSPQGAENLRLGMEATAALNEYLAAMMSTGHRSGCPADLIGQMVASPLSGKMTAQEMTASVAQLVFAGNETTAKLMATTLYALARFPDQRRLLLDDRELIPRALEEIHRWMSVIHVGWRVPRDGKGLVSGVHIPDGATILVLQGAANRDPARWENPDVLDVRRTPRSHLGFGFGMHHCLGINLARLEMVIWLNRILDEFPDWDVFDVDWGRGWVARGPVRLTIGS